MKKPKIRKHGGWWCCYTAWNQVGIGSSPVIAYDNWKMQVSGLMRKQGEI